MTIPPNLIALLKALAGWTLLGLAVALTSVVLDQLKPR